MAVVEIKRNLIAAVRRARRAEKFVTLVLLFILLTAAAAGVTNVLIGPDWALLWESLLFGLLIGWALAILQWPVWRSAGVILTVGILFALLSAGGLGAKLWAVIAELSHLPYRMTISPTVIRIDLAPLSDLTAELWNSAGVVSGRVTSWLEALFAGLPSFDPVAAGLVWNTLVWVVAAWAGWMVEATGNALLAVLPAMLLNMGTLSYGRSTSFSIYLILGATLVLIAVVQYDRREQEWDKNKVAYPPRKDRQVGYTAVILAIGLVLVSAFASSLSFQRISSWVSEIRGPSAQPDNGLAKSLGIQAPTSTPDAFTPLRSPGLPRDLLIGSGPELSTELVMSVEVKDLPSLVQSGKLPPLYWRSFTYDNYTGHGWSSSVTRQVQYPADQPVQLGQLPGHLPVREVVRKVPGVDQNVYAAGEPVSVNAPMDAAWRSSNDLFGIQTVSNGYEIQSLIPVADESGLRSAGQKYPEWIAQRYLALPQDLPARVKQLAIQLTASEPTPYDRARAIEQYLHKFPYSLEVPRPPANRDVVDFFLFDIRKGYCDNYASAMVVLARAAGVPARLAIGYSIGTYNLNSKRFMVTQADAHSWVEVYFPGIGWVPFEPTAAQPAINRSVQPAQQVSPTPISPGGKEYSAKNRPVWIIVFAGLALVSMAGMLWAAYDKILLQRMEPQTLAAEIYMRMRRYGTRMNLSVDPGETPYEFSAALCSGVQDMPRFQPARGAGASLIAEVELITGRIVRLSYRPSEAKTALRIDILGQWSSLRWQLCALWILKSWQALRRQFREWLAGLPGNTSTQLSRKGPG